MNGIFCNRLDKLPLWGKTNLVDNVRTGFGGISTKSFKHMDVIIAIEKLISTFLSLGLDGFKVGVLKHNNESLLVLFGLRLVDKLVLLLFDLVHLSVRARVRVCAIWNELQCASPSEELTTAKKMLLFISCRLRIASVAFLQHTIYNCTLRNILLKLKR
jgi:hypothetical protein